MTQYGMKQNNASTDAAMCAPAADAAPAKVFLDTAMCAVSFFVALVLVVAVSLRLVGLLALVIIGLLVVGKQENAKSVFARIFESA